MSFPGEELSQTDAAAEDSSVPQPETTQSESQTAAPSEGEQPKEDLERQVPFHEHPRFKELIEERRTYAQQLETMKSQMAEMQRQQQDAVRAAQPPKQRSKFLEDLSGVNPEYAKYMEELESRAGKAEHLEQRFQEFERQRIVNEYENTVSKLHMDSKLPAELQPLVRQQLDALARTGAIKDMKDVPTAYKQIADTFNKFSEGLRRSTTASYVQDKSKDASTPASQPKGKTPPRNTKGQFTGDREQDMAIIARRALKIAKGESDL